MQKRPFITLENKFFTILSSTPSQGSTDAQGKWVPVFMGMPNSKGLIYAVFILILFLLGSLIGCSNTPSSNISETLIQLQDPLDEPEFYCVDVPGFRDSLDLEGALTAHTCKPNSEDELFVFEAETGQLRMEAYGLCVEAGGATAGAELFLRDCDPERPLQQFSFTNDQIQLDDALCLAVSAANGEPTGGPSHLRRDLLLQPCNAVEPALAQWKMPGPEPLE